MLIRRPLRIVSLLLAILGVFATGNAQAGHICLCNCDFQCPDKDCNQFTIVLVPLGSAPVNITQLYVGQSDQPRQNTQALPPADMPPPPPASQKGEFIQVDHNNVIAPTGAAQFIHVTGNGTNSLRVTFDTRNGTPFPRGYWTHVGFFNDTPGDQNTAKFQDSSWAFNGAQVDSKLGHMPGVNFQGTSSNWLITRVTLYDPLGQVTGHEWAESQASSWDLSGSGVDLRYSTAFAVSPTMIPLDQLTENLPLQFSPESSIQDLSAVPEPSTLTLALAGSLAVFGRAWLRRKKT